MQRKPIIELTRQALYDKIWSISVSGLAKELGIPYAHLMTQVKGAGVPVPPSGYWTKISFGKPVEAIPLSGDTEAVVAIYHDVKLRPDSEKETSNSKSETKSVPQSAVSVKTEKSTSKQEPPESEITTTTISAAQELPPVETRARSGQLYNVYDRETLYKEVWEMPVSEVAKRYQISDVMISKVCKSLNIPTPPRGYWAKRKAGKPTEILPLPQTEGAVKKEGVRTGPKPQLQASASALQTLSEADRAVVLSVAAQILLPDAKAIMHPQIVAHRKRIAEWRKDKRFEDAYYRRNHKDEIPFLAEDVSETALPRACRIIDALIKAVEPLGCSMTADLKFKIGKETVMLSFNEAKDSVPHIPTKEENKKLLQYEETRRKHSWASKPNIPKYDYVFNGKLSLSVDGYSKYRDCKAYVLEDRLGDLLIQIYEAAETQRIKREEREEAERKRAEQQKKREALERRYDEEIDRTNALLNEARDYERALTIRSYIFAVEQKGSLSDDELDWVSWAKLKADWYDPTIRREDEFFGCRKHAESDDCKEPKKYHPYRW